MNTLSHDIPTLFAQLGLASQPADIQRFLDEHANLPEDVALADAPWWSAAQADFLRTALAEDGDWAEPVDELNALLHH